jgi:uncharacterized membrane protein YkvA (DUF1232 family)
MQTVGQLRHFLADRGWSCERLSNHVAVSNMTWRRLLRLPDSEPIPQKYRPHLEPLSQSEFLQPARDGGLPDPVALVISGLGGTEANALRQLSSSGRNESTPETLWSRISKISAELVIPTLLTQLVSELKPMLNKASRSGRLLVFGALAYFVNPLDLIADHLITIGLLDDIGVMMLVKSHLTARRNR